MTGIDQIEEQLNHWLQETIMPVSRGLHVGWPNLPAQLSRQANVLFLGNHSSGKSSFINHLLQIDLQKTGMAPTDDGFTVITAGAMEDTIDGHAAVSNPVFALGHLRNLGPSFLSRLRVKTCPSPLLQEVRLIDSPGMIDQHDGGSGRGYDFHNAVRTFAESADLILVFFDPDKPGTTGETMSVFTETLAGLEHKLVILLHKVDQMASLSDFARSYGTLCWNLSRRSTTKDMPQIFTTYIPEKVSRHRANDPDALDLAEFARSLDEVEKEIRRAPLRRIDNLLTEIERRSRWLEMALNIIRSAQSRRFKTVALTWAVTVLSLALGGIWAWAERESFQTAITVGIIALLVSTVAYVAGNYWLKLDNLRFLSEDGLDDLFRSSFQKEFQIGHRADIHATWASVKPSLRKILKNPGLDELPGNAWITRKLHILDKLLFKDIPPLRQKTQEIRISGSAGNPDTPDKDHPDIISGATHQN